MQPGRAEVPRLLRFTGASFNRIEWLAGLSQVDYFRIERLLPGEMKDDKKETTNEALLSEVQIILAEKRTALAVMRTGIAVFALPLTVLSLLVATSKYYQPAHVLHFLLPLLALSAALAGLGSYLIIHLILRIRHYDRRLNQLKRQYGSIAELME